MTIPPAVKERVKALLPRSVLRRLAPLSPGQRRWKAFLRALPLDLAQLPESLPAPSEHDFIMCGVPRSGTTLLTAMLFQPPQVVTVMEPWDGMRMPPALLFASLRAEIEGTGRLARGQLDVEVLRREGVVRWCKEGASRPRIEGLQAGYLVGVKWPAFYRYLPRLPETKFLVCVRDPYEVVSSAKRNGGRLQQGLQFDMPFNRELNAHLEAATDDLALRRVLLYDYFNERLLPFLDRPNVFAVRYERWFDDPQGLLADLGDFLGTTLTSGVAELRPPKRVRGLTSREIALVREHCQTGRELGYDLERIPPAAPV